MYKAPVEREGKVLSWGQQEGHGRVGKRGPEKKLDPLRHQGHVRGRYSEGDGEPAYV